MAAGKQYTAQDPNGNRFDFRGICTNLPVDAMPAGLYPYAQNVRAYQKGTIGSRSAQGPIVAAIPDTRTVHTVKYFTEQLFTPGGGLNHHIISGIADKLYMDTNVAASGLSGKSLSIVPFRPNTSVQPWAYIADASGMRKVRGDGLLYKMGIAEPQAPPTVGTQTTSTSGSITLLGSAVPWSNQGGQNPSYNYGDNGTGTPPAVIATPTANSSITITATGTVTISGATHGPSDTAVAPSNFPGHFVTNNGPCATIVGAFTDTSGNVVQPVSQSDLDVVSVGGQATLLVPTNAARLQLGINAAGGTFASNTGSFAVQFSVATSAISTAVGLADAVTAYYWGGNSEAAGSSPHSGPVGLYIWRNETDGGGWGPTRGVSSATGSTTGSSLIFDKAPGNGGAPVAWTVFDNAGNNTGTTSVFQPALETQGYQDFSMCITADIFFPAQGNYTLSVTYKDGILWGLGNNASWPGVNTVIGQGNQRKTVVSNLPLLTPSFIANSGGQSAGGSNPSTSSVVVTIPGPGIYPFEVDWDYYDKSGRTLVVQCNGQDLKPLAGSGSGGGNAGVSLKNQVQYRYTYRSSVTGAVSNPSPESFAQTIPVFANALQGSYCSDPQVDKIDFYRIDSVISNYTYVATAPNTSPPTQVTDTQLDTDITGNQLLEYDNFEPFPSLDLPRRGTVNVVGSTIQWVSGDQFNTRWLPGSLVNIGGIAYTLDKRPTSNTTMTATGVASGNGLLYEIDAATLAGQPMQSMWGPTSAGNFMFACGDPLRPGTVYWTKGNNPDSAPDTNQLELTSPSEPLVNGCVANGVSVVFSADRAWVFYPITTSAQATVTGVLGDTFNPTLSAMTRGLAIRTCLAVAGGGEIFFRAKDGICVSVGGGSQQSLTDETLYNLFPHEDSNPGPVTVGGYTIWPPDDTQPESQHLSFATGYLYYDYLDVNGHQRTLVYDTSAGGWVVDAYQVPVSVHALQEGSGVNGTLLGCADGQVRIFNDGSAENAQCAVLTSSQNAGTIRDGKQIGDIFLRTQVQPGTVLAVTPYQGRYGLALTGYAPATFSGTGLWQDSVIDMSGGAREVDDIALMLTWNVDLSTLLSTWQASWFLLPEIAQARVTDWTDAGYPGEKFIQGVRIEANTYGKAKNFQIQSSNDLSLHLPLELPWMWPGQSTRVFSVSPFISHSVRLVPSDAIPWRLWSVEFIYQPYPEQAESFQSEMVSYAPGWQSIRELNLAYIAPSPVTVTLTFDQWPTIVLPVMAATPSQLYPVKTKMTVPANKSKLMAFGLSSAQPFRLFRNLVEVKVGAWGRDGGFNIVQPFGGETKDGAEV